MDVPTFVNFGIANNGPASTPEFVWVYLYIDDVLIDNVSWDGLLAYRSSEVVGRDNILEIISLAPGVHTLRVVVDATNRVVESDESNNVLEREFTWGSGPVPPKPIALPTPEPTPPAPLVLPNLVPGWRFGWDSPIIVSHESESFLDNPLSVNDKAYVTVVVQNQSIIRASQTFDVDLYFDGEKVNTTEFTGETEAAFLRWKVWENLNDQVQITPGAHTLKIVIDAENSVEEANENDNVYEKTLVWAAEGPVAAKPVFYTDEELQQKLLGLWTLLDTRESVISEDRPDLAERVFNIADAAYYLVTGTSIWNERVAIFLLSHGDYLNWIDDSFFRKFALNEASEYPEILAARERFKRISLGFKTRRFWKVAIVVDADNDPARVLNSLAHELGHMRQDFLNPRQTEDEQSFSTDGIQEAQAQQFERVFWLALEEFTGLSLLKYPDYRAFGSLVDDRYNIWLTNADQEEHSLGYLLQWLTVLDDPALSDLRNEIAESGELSRSSSLRLYDYLVGLDPDTIQGYVTTRLNNMGAYLPTIISVSKQRLVSNLHPDDEGLSDLRVPSLMMP